MLREESCARGRGRWLGTGHGGSAVGAGGKLAWFLEVRCSARWRGDLAQCAPAQRCPRRAGRFEGGGRCTRSSG